MRHFLFTSLSFCLVAFAYGGDKVTQSVIVASVEGEVSSLNMIDDFKVTMGPSSVGKKISPKTILTTGKSGKVSLLFSNGTLITVKQGSRFYLRQYKQLEAVVEDLPQPGELEEEPTKSELSAHLDFGELIVKAPKLKKGSSMNLTSPLGTAGIRGTMFQLMAVRNSVSGDIMGGINLISGDIDFTDTGGNTVTLLSGQSIQLATSKLGEAVASQTGELVDLSSTYGPALTEPGAMPPPLATVFPGLGEGGDDSEEEDSSEDSSEVEDLSSDNQVVTGGGGDWDFIHEISSEVFFEIESSEVVSSTFSFADIQIAPSVETPIPEVQAPAPPARITGDTGSGQNIDQYLGAPPTISLLDRSLQPAELVEVKEGGNRLVVEMRSPEENIRWADIDPGVLAVDFVTTDITSNVVLSQIPQFILENPADAPLVGQTFNFEVIYQITDFRSSRSSITRTVELVATRPTIELNLPTPFSIPTTDPKNQIAQWADIQKETIRDVRGEILFFDPDRTGDKGTFYFKNELTFGVNEPGIKTLSLIAKDWRGLTTESSPFTIEVTETSPIFVTQIPQPQSVPRTDPQGLFADWVTNQFQTAQIRDENGTLLIFDSREGLNQESGSNGTFFFSPFPSVGDANDSIQQAEDVTFQIIAKDWRGLTSSQDFTLRLTTERPVLPVLPVLPAVVRTDPAGAFIGWIDELVTLRGQDEIGDDLDFDTDGNKRGTFFLSPYPSVGDANDSNQLAEEISFQVVAKDWRGLTTESDLLTLSLSAEAPTIDSLPQNLLNPKVPLTDPNGVFVAWIQDVVNFIEGNNLIQSEENVLKPIVYDENASELKSTYYFSTPDLNSLGSKVVKLSATDWRGLVTTSDLQIEVFADPPEIYDGPNALVFELSDRLLPQLDHNITGEDQFGNNELTISLETVTANDGTDISNFEDMRLDQFDQNNMPYSFFYKIIDSRGIETNQTKFLSAAVTPPLLNSPQFESKFQSVSSDDSTMEYRDYLEELPDWLEGAEAQHFSTDTYLTAPNSDITKTIISFFNESGDSQSSLPELQAEQMEPGTYEIKFSYIDPRYIDETTHISWQDDLEIANVLPLYVESTPPTIELRNGQENTLEVELSNIPLNEFLDHGLVATHEFGKDELQVSLVQVWDAENQNVDTDTSFLKLSDTPYQFTYRAVDYRGVSTDFNRTVQIVVTSPTIDIDDFESNFTSDIYSKELDDKTLEYYDPGNELGSWLRGAVGKDTVNDEILTVSAFQNGTQVSPSLTDEDPNNNDHLPVGEYIFTFEVTDPRWLQSPNPVWEDDLVISESRNLSVIATPPVINGPVIAQTQDQEVDNRNWADLDPWSTSLSATDVRQDNIPFSSDETGQPEKGEFRLLDPPDLFSEDSIELVYTVRDWRGIENSTMTTLNVIKTAPTIEFGYYDGARAGLSASDDAIKYLVRTEYNEDIFPDDGPFDILPWKENEADRDLAKPYFKATAYDGVDISDLVSVDPTIIDYANLGTQNLVINVDDSEYRKKDENRDRPVGATNSLSLSVEIVDVIAPIMELVGDSSFTIDGIISSNVDGNYKFPDPGYTIKDNFYSQQDIESFLNIQSNEITTFNYPEYNDVSGFEQGSETVVYDPSSFKIFPDELIIGSTIDLGAAGSYELQYQNITDLSGNQADVSLVRDVEVRDIRHPIVKLYGSSTISENLAEILLGEQFYSDRGAFAYEDLSSNANGKVDWQEEGWDWSVEIKNWDFVSSSWIDYIEFEPAENNFILLNSLGDDPIESLIEEFIKDPTEVPSELRFRLTYVLRDKADNNGSAQRVINFSNTSNLAPTVELADGEIDNPYEVEVFSLESAPAVDAFLGYSQYSTPVTPRSNVYYLAADDSNLSVNPTWNKVNFHRNASGNEYYVDAEGNWHSYGDAEWRKFIIHYSAENPDFPENIGTLDLEVRIQDTTPPSFSVPTDLSVEAGFLFSDEGLTNLVDNYDTNPTSSKIVQKLEGSVYSELESPANSDDVFDDLSSSGFWSPGQYSIFYTATDDFNNSTVDSYNIQVTDSIAPHIALITEDFLNNPSVNLLAEYDEETSYSDVPNSNGVPYFNQSLYTGSPWNTLWDAISSPDGWSGSTFNKSSPYIEYYNDRQFYLKLSDITNLSDLREDLTSSTVVTQDDFGRSLIWLSAFNIQFVDGTSLQDPGVLVVNGSDYDVSNSVQISETNSSGQLTHMKFTYQASDGVSSNEILSEYRKTLSFLDEEKPQISLIPEDTIGLTGPSNSQYFLIEAGVNYLTDTRASGFNLWAGDTSTSVPDALSDSTSYALSVSAFDAVDGDLTEGVQRSFFDAEDNSSVAWSSSTLSGLTHLNKTYFIKYDVRDGDNTDDDSVRNDADSVYRYFIVKDTTAPAISDDKNNTTVTLSSDSTDPDVSDISAVKSELISDLTVSDIIDSDFTDILDWNITIGKSPNPLSDDYDGSEVYPEISSDGGYYVTITVSDESGNVSPPISRRLKIGDYRAPVITLNGQAIIHDFFRYGKNDGFDNNLSAPQNQELLFADQAESTSFNSTGFSGGAHRLFLSQYNFIDPGAYAQDGNNSSDQGYFNTNDGFPDFNADGAGEGHAILRKSSTFSLDADDMDAGIIYARSSLTDTTFQEVQEALEELSTYSTSEYSSLIPDVNSSSFAEENKAGEENHNIQLYQIEYRVKDGWGNLSEIKTRRVYFYESRQFGNTAFYATPLKEATDITNDFPGQNLTALSDNQKDYDGDGISDFWENALGYDPNDASSFPDSNEDGIPDLGSNQFFQNLSVTIPD